MSPVKPMILRIKVLFLPFALGLMLNFSYNEVAVIPLYCIILFVIIVVKLCFVFFTVAAILSCSCCSNILFLSRYVIYLGFRDQARCFAGTLLNGC